MISSRNAGGVVGGGGGGGGGGSAGPGENPADGTSAAVAAFTRPSSAVVVRSAYKQYGQTAILKDLNLTIPDGKM